jgi:hypothetical protein
MAFPMPGFGGTKAMLTTLLLASLFAAEPSVDAGVDAASSIEPPPIQRYQVGTGTACVEDSAAQPGFIIRYCCPQGSEWRRSKGCVDVRAELNRIEKQLGLADQMIANRIALTPATIIQAIRDDAAKGQSKAKPAPPPTAELTSEEAEWRAVMETDDVSDWLLDKSAEAKSVDGGRRPEKW